MRALAPWIRGYRSEWLRPDLLAGVTVAVAGAHAHVRGMFDRSGLTERIGAHRMYPTVAAAVSALAGEAAKGP